MERVSDSASPPRVEYQLTPLGTRLNDVLDRIAALQDDVDRGVVARGPHAGPGV
jgi:DNA-binding HxlR family transcriptional regulator